MNAACWSPGTGDGLCYFVAAFPEKKTSGYDYPKKLSCHTLQSGFLKLVSFSLVSVHKHALVLQ